MTWAAAVAIVLVLGSVVATGRRRRRFLASPEGFRQALDAMSPGRHGAHPPLEEADGGRGPGPSGVRVHGAGSPSEGSEPG